MPANLYADYEDDCDNRIRCEHCEEPLTEDDHEDFGCCEACHEENQRAAEKGWRDGAGERSYTEDEAA